MVKSAWPPAPTLPDVPEPAPESEPTPAPAPPAGRVVDFSRPPIEATVVEAVVEPEADRNAPNVATGWRTRRDRPAATDDGPAAREVVIPEIVHDLSPRWATPPTAEPDIDLTADDAGGSDVEVVEARKPEPPTFDLPARARAVRVKTVKTQGKRRWVVDVLIKQHDEDDNPK